MDRILTKHPMVLQSSVRLLQGDVEIVIAAARLQGISRSEFLRRSVVEKAKRVLRKSQREEQQLTS